LNLYHTNFIVYKFYIISHNETFVILSCNVKYFFLFKLYEKISKKNTKKVKN